MAIIESRKIWIGRKVFTLVDLKKIASVFESLKTGSDQERIIVKIECIDECSYASSGTDVLNDVSATAKKIQSVSMSYINLSDDKEVNLFLNHGDSGPNTFSCSGADRAWVNGLLTTIQDILGTVKPQKCFIRDHSLISISLLAISFAFGLHFIFNIAVQWKFIEIPPLPSHIPVIVPFIFSWSLFLLFGLMAAAWNLDKLLKYWPWIEIQADASHLNIEQQTRARIYFIVAFALPIFADRLFYYLM